MHSAWTNFSTEELVSSGLQISLCHGLTGVSSCHDIYWHAFRPLSHMKNEFTGGRNRFPLLHNCHNPGFDFTCSLRFLSKVDTGVLCFFPFRRLSWTVFLAFSWPFNLTPLLHAPPWPSVIETPHWEREQKSTHMPSHKDVPYRAQMENAIRRFFTFATVDVQIFSSVGHWRGLHAHKTNKTCTQENTLLFEDRWHYSSSLIEENTPELCLCLQNTCPKGHRLGKIKNDEG